MTGKDTDILCVGNALADVYARDEGLISCHYGITRPIQHVEIEKVLALVSMLPGAVVVSGGGAANAAKIAGFLGTKVCFTGALGKGSSGASDEFGRIFEENLAAAGVELKLCLKPSPTGIFLSLETGAGENRIAASPSAAGEFSENDLDSELFKRAKVVVVDGFMWDRPALVRRVFELAGNSGAVAALDLGSASAAREHAAEIAGFTRRCPFILFMNEAEAIAFHEGLGAPEGVSSREGGPVFPADEDPRLVNACGFLRVFTRRAFTERAFVREGAFPVAVVKLGERGALCFADGNCFRAETGALKPENATGAGDAFCAGFLSAWIRGRSLIRCMETGNKTARIVLDVPGTLVEGTRFAALRAALGQNQ